MVGAGAEAFAKERGGIEFVPESYFRTDLRWQQLQRALEEERTKQGALLRPRDDQQQGAYFGTVGAVALDKAGNLAAATSTGGVTNKRFGRVGDSPIIGAGRTRAIRAVRFRRQESASISSGFRSPTTSAHAWSIAAQLPNRPQTRSSRMC